MHLGRGRKCIDGWSAATLELGRKKIFVGCARKKKEIFRPPQGAPVMKPLPTGWPKHAKALFHWSVVTPLSLRAIGPCKVKSGGKKRGVIGRASYKMMMSHRSLSTVSAHINLPHLSLTRPVPIPYAYTQYNISSHSYNYNNTIITLAIAIITTIIIPQVFHLFPVFYWSLLATNFQVLLDPIVPPASIYWIPGRLHLTEPLTGLYPALCFSNFVCSVQLERWPSLNVAAQYHWTVNRKDSHTQCFPVRYLGLCTVALGLGEC